MPYSRTLLQLRTAFLQLGGFENSLDITPAVANQYILDALEESYGLIVACADDFYVIVGAPFALVAGTGTYALPSDFYDLRRVEIQRGTDWWKMLPASIDEGTRARSSNVRGTRYRYRVSSSGFIVTPTPTTTESVRLHYLPLAPQPAADTDSVTFDRPVEQKLVLHIALRDVMLRSDLDTTAMENKIALLSKQLRDASDSHDLGAPFYLSDHGAEDDEECW